MDLERQVVVQVREGNPVLCAHRLTNDDLVDIIEFVPIFISAREHFKYIYNGYGNYIGFNVQTVN